MPVESSVRPSLTDVMRALIDRDEKRLTRELAMGLFVGPYAVLLQAAHPEVARAGITHSYGLENLGARALRTLPLTVDLFVKTDDEARRAASQINVAHLYQAKTGNPAARDPNAIEWVWMTLVKAAFVGHEYFIGPLTNDEKQQFFDHSRARVALLGVTKPTCTSASGVDTYIDDMIARGVIHVTDQARVVVKELWKHFEVNQFLRFSGNFVGQLTARLLPPPLVEQYRLPWQPLSDQWMTVTQIFWRSILPHVTSKLRGVS